MVSSREANEEFGRISSFKNILETYEEIAASRMQNTRSSVLEGRNFIEELNYIFQQVKSSYKDQMAEIMKKKHIKDSKEFTFIERNSRTLFVLLSSNTGLYGDIVRKTYNLFVDLIKKERADASIVGRTGVESFQNAGIDVPFSYFDMPDSSVDNKALKKIVAHIIQYQRVFVVYGRFENVISQEPIVTSI